MYTCIPFVGAIASNCNLGDYDNQHILFKVLPTFPPGKLQVFEKIALFLARVKACSLNMVTVQNDNFLLVRTI